MVLPTPEYPGATWDGNEQSEANDPGSPDPTIAEGRDHNKMSTEVVAIEADLRAAFIALGEGSIQQALIALDAAITALNAHASQHKHGGSDEVAQSTPAPNAIPKAGGAGTLSSGWLSQATELAKGVAEIATQAQTDAGTDDERFVTPLKLSTWHLGADPFGNDAQQAISTARSTTTSTAFQPKASLTTPAGLNGTYRVAWSCYIDQAATNQEVQARLQNTTDVVTVGGLAVFQPKIVAERTHAGGLGYVTFTGSAKTFELQYSVVAAGTAGISDAVIEFWRVS